MHVFVAQINPTVGDFQGNTEKIIQAIQRGQKQKCDIVLFPELAICGYPPEDLLLHPSFVDSSEASLKKIIESTSNIIAIVGLARHAEDGEKGLLNSAAIIENKKLLGFQDKWLLPTYDVFDERRYFEPGSRISVWELKGKKVAVTVCEDIWQHAGEVVYTNYAKDPIDELIPLKPDLVLNLSSSPYQFQKPHLRVSVCAKSAKTLKCPLIMCCQVGGNDQLVFDGYSIYVDGQGQLIQLGKGFVEDDMIVDLNIPPKPSTVHPDHLGDLYQALVLGVKDYFKKQGFKRGCLGLSGGIDSALVACIAVDALGKENVLGLTMPSRYSSEHSITDARELAKNLGVETLHVPIEKIFTDFLNLLEPHFQNKPWDTTEENLQARIRGMIQMAISNKFGYIVLSTGNKSELALGYCTLYGDMVGGLAVISDVTKEQVYALSHYINRKKEIIPQSTIAKPPSAELRPNQLDTDSLPDYAIVDAVLQSYVEEYLSPEQISKKHNIPLEIVKDLIHRIHLAEYKRRQAAPGIRVSKKAFRVGRRYPIVQKWM